MLYALALLATVCQDYFVPSLEIMADYFDMPSDVAGATLMAMGTSAPELFSSIFGAFVSEGDIGVSTIVGSAVFNIVGVTALIGFISGTNSILVDWYPVTRDSIAYAITVAVLVIVLGDGAITWWESLIMLILFGVYIIFMYYNAAISRWSHRMIRHMNRQEPHKTGKNRTVSYTRCPSIIVDKQQQQQQEQQQQYLHSNSIRSSFHNTEKTPLLKSSGKYTFSEVASSSASDEYANLSRRESALISSSVREFLDSEPPSIFSAPEGNIFYLIYWVAVWPAKLLFWLTIPDCRKGTLKNWFAITFLVSMAWIGVLSYLSVWMVTTIGSTFGIPDSISGITFLAVGTSMPEAISSLIVAKAGLGNMALCNLLGSNVFDILFCLGLPWLVKALIQNGPIIMSNSGVTFSAAILLTTVILLYLLFLSFRWKINWKIGAVCLFIYAAYITVAVLFDLNFFGQFNLPQCSL